MGARASGPRAHSLGVLNVDTRFHQALTEFWFLGAQPRASMQRAVMRSTLFL
jgi:hypothetical protein